VKISIFKTSGNGFAKMVCVAKIAFDVSGVEFFLLSAWSTISPYDYSKYRFEIRTKLISYTRCIAQVPQNTTGTSQKFLKIRSSKLLLKE